MPERICGKIDSMATLVIVVDARRHEIVRLYNMGIVSYLPFVNVSYSN